MGGGGGKVNVWMHIAGAVLSICAGIVNICAFYSFGSSVSSMSGNLSKAGGRLEGRMSGDAGEKVFLCLSFIVGSFSCGLLIAHNNVHFGQALYDLGLIGTCVLLVLAVVLHEEKSAKYFAAMACGLQNGMTTQYNGAVIRTTHVTGTLTDAPLMAGRMVARFLRRGCRCSAYDNVDKAETEVEKRKLLLLCLLAVSFFVGSIIGSSLYRKLEVRAMLIPAGITGAAGVAYMCYRVVWLHHKLFDTSEQELVEVPLPVMSEEVEDRETAALCIAAATHDAHVEGTEHEKEMHEERLTVLTMANTHKSPSSSLHSQPSHISQNFVEDKEKAAPDLRAAASAEAVGNVAPSGDASVLPGQAE